MNRVRTLNEEGFVSDGLGAIKPGDVFLTKSGRTTTPYPKAKSDVKINEWDIDNALKEAEARGDRFNVTQFKAMDAKNMSVCDKQSISLYMYG